MTEGRTPKKGDRVVWRGKSGTVVDDYWKDRDRYSVLFDGESEPLDFGAAALRSRITERQNNV